MRFTHPAIQTLAKKYNKEPTQILLRYSLQKVQSTNVFSGIWLMLMVKCPQGYIPIPKSASKKRVISNTEVFDFNMTDDEIKGLDALDECECSIRSYPAFADGFYTDLVTDWDPTDCP